ncbi:hypothetical protein ACFV9G_25580 [Nocardioides sp. NPDC059952]|uniref:hypothetical protein n=1 Tax=Nocardioides sp. NPDC059952 TaxID=3347014 RepID=UPI00365A7B97
MSTARRGVPWWAWLLVAGAVFVVVAGVGLVGLVAWVGTDLGESGEAAPADCVDLAQAVGLSDLPAGSSHASCTYMGFQDWQIDGAMTVPRADLDTWLARLPGSPVLGETGCTADAVACVQVDLTQVGDEVDAHYLDVAVLSESDGVAEVRMAAFTT